MISRAEKIEASKLLVQLLTNREPDVRNAARKGLADMAGDGTAESVVVDAIHNLTDYFPRHDDRPPALANLAEALDMMVATGRCSELAEGALPALIAYANDLSRSNDRFSAAFARVLAHFPQLRGISTPLLRKFLKQPCDTQHTQTHQDAARALGKLWQFSPERVDDIALKASIAEDLIPLIAADDKAVRECARDALVDMAGDGSAERVILRFIERPERHVRDSADHGKAFANAAEALMEIAKKGHSRETLVALDAMIDRVRALDVVNDGFGAAVAKVLGAYPELAAKSVPVLREWIAATQSNNGRITTAATEAIAQLLRYREEDGGKSDGAREPLALEA